MMVQQESEEHLMVLDEDNGDWKGDEMQALLDTLFEKGTLHLQVWYMY